MTDDNSDAHSANRQHRRTGPHQRPNPLADLPDKILELLRTGPAGELEQHLKTLVAQVADRMDLVPREEFEIQKAVLERLRERIETLEKQLDDRSDKTERPTP